jgi:hypothetical protein
VLHFEQMLRDGQPVGPPVTAAAPSSPALIPVSTAAAESSADGDESVSLPTRWPWWVASSAGGALLIGGVLLGYRLSRWRYRPQPE